MLAEIDGIAVILHLASAGIYETHERISAVQRSLCEIALHTLGGFTDTDGKRRVIEQLMKPFHRCSFKDKGHEVVFLVIEQIGNVFAFCGGNRKSTCDFSADTDNVVILSVQLCGKPRLHSLGAGDQRGKGKRPLAGQFVHQTCPQHTGQRV